jgi:hypothetical protein
VEDYLLQTTWTNHYDGTNQIHSAELKSYLLHYFSTGSEHVLRLSPATAKGEIIEIPQPNWHFFVLFFIQFYRAESHTEQH